MISYDNYKNRIQKLAKAKRILHKFRFVICGALALIVGTSVGLMVAKGSYTSGMSLSAQSVMFNEDYEVEAAKAFLCSSSEQYVEYRAENGDWTRKKPVKAGKYSARTVTRKLVGYNYSSAVDFEILPVEADFTITGTSVTYGSAPAFTVPQLVSGHSVDKSALQFEYAVYGAPSTEVNVVESSIKIVDESGDDFTDCYTITPHGSTLAVNKKNITVKPADYEFTYDAQPHFAENTVTEETLANLVKGDTLTVTTAISNYAGGAVNAGAYTVGCNGIQIMHGDTDISGWYDISSLTSELKVARRKLTLTTGDAEKVYDGTPAENALPDCENLVEGHSASVDAATLCKSANVGTYDNVYEVTISDGTTDVTGNYEIDEDTSKYGKLTIKPRPIVIELNAIDDVTYGETFAYKDEAGNYANLPDLAVGEKLKIAVIYRQDGEIVTPKDAGWYSAELDLENCAFYDMDGKEIEGGVNNYSVECAPLDSLKINKFEFIIKPLDLTKENGAEVTYGDEVKYPDYLGNYFGLSSKEAGAYDITELPYGEQIKIIGLIRITDETGNDVPDKLNVGTYRITAGYIAVFDSYGNAIQSDANYNFAASEFADLEVVPREITVTVDDKTAPYGEALPENSFTITKGALQYDEELTLTTHYEQGGETCAPETWEGYTLLNAGTYSIIYNNDEAIVGGNASVDNYAFEFVPGTLEITARGIIVTTATDEKIYDGKPLENDGYTTVWANDNTKKGLLKDAELIKDTNNTVVNPPVAGPYLNVCNYKVPNANYVIADTKFGTLTITPRPVIVYTGSASKTYDGSPLTCEEYADVKFAVQDEATGKWTADDGKTGLIAGDGLRLASKLVEITNVGETENANEYANGNYNIVDYVNGMLSVTKEHLEISMRYQSTSAVYGNYPDGFMVLQDIPTDGLSGLITADGKELKLPDGQWLAVYFDIVGVDGAPDVGSYTVKAYYYKIYSIDGTLLDEGDGDSLENYTISCADGELEIFAYSLEGKVNDQTAVYGDKLSDNECDIEHGAFETKYPLGENIEFEFGYDREVKNVGEYEITVTGIKVYDKDGSLKEDGAKNYDFGKIQIGTLTVTAKHILLQIAPSSFNYGDTVTDPEYKINGFEYGDKITDIKFHYFIRTDLQTVDNPKNAGTYGVNIGLLEINGKEIKTASEEENYYVSVAANVLTITKASLTVTFAGNAVKYGDDLTDFIPEYTTDLDGNMPYNESFEIGGFTYLTDGEEAPERKNAGEYEIEGKDIVFYDEDGNEIANGENNYVITYEGTLTIKQKEIDIKLVDQTYVYGDAYAHFTGGWASEIFYVFKDSGEFDYLEYGEVLSVKFKFSQSGEEVTPRYVGDYVMSAAEFRVSDSVGGELKAASNYIINCDDGKLTITARPITVYVQDYELTYGETLVFRNVMFRDIEGVEHSESGRYQMPYGDNLAVVFLLDGKPLISDKIYDAGTHTISVTKWYVQNSSVEGKEVPNENYEIEWVDGTLTVLPRTIFVGIDENNETTYGTAPEDIGYKIYIEDKGEVVEYALPEGDEFSADFEYYAFGDPDRTIIEVKNAGEYGVTVAKAYINGEETAIGAENYVEGNYVIEVIDGKLTVNKKSVTVVLNQIDPVYYGETFTYAAGVDNYVNFYTIELAYNERLEVVVKYLIDGKDGEPKNVNYEEPRNGHEESYHFAYSASLDDGACVVYESDGKTVVANGAENYDFVCDDLVDLKIMRRTVYIYLDDLDDVEYGDEVKYPEGINNFKRVEYKDGETVVEGAPYDEQFEVEVEYLDKNGKVVDKPVSIGTYKIKLNGITVYDENGNRLTYGASNYAFATAEPYQGTVNVIPRKITIYLSDYEMEYGEFYIQGEGGTFEYPDCKYNYDTDKSDELAYNQPLWVGYMDGVRYQKVEGGKFVTPKDVGTYIITIDEDDYAIFNADETHWDGSYDITFIPGTLTITQKAINVVVSSERVEYGKTEFPEHGYKFIYDGEEHYWLPYDDEFTAGDNIYYLSTDEDKNSVTPRNAGLYGVTFADAEINGGVVNVESTDGNYFITVTDGELEILKANISVTLNDLADVIYGKPVQFTEDDVTVTGLQYGETLNVAVIYTKEGEEEPSTPKSAGTYTIDLDEENTTVNSEDEAAKVLTCNYTVVYVTGEVTILPRAVKVTFDEQNRIYGEEIEDDTFTIEVNVDDITDGSITSNALPYGEELEIDTWYFDGNDHLGSPRNTGTYRIDAKTVTVVGDDGAAENYTLTYDAVNLKISPKTINIKLDDMTATYGDYEFTQPDTNTFSPKTDEDALEYDDKLVINIRFTLVDNENSAALIERYNVGEYSIVATQFTVTYFDETVEISANGKLSNYEIVCEYGTLEVTPKQLHVAISKEVEITYGENAPKYEDIPYTVTSGGEIITELPYEDTLGVGRYYVVEGVGTPVNAGTYVIKYDGADINLGEFNDNYDISGEDGLLTIKQIEIEVTIKGGKAVYGDEGLPEIAHEVTVGEMVGEEKLVPAYVFSLNGTPCEPVNVGVYDITVDEENCKVEGGNKLYENYKVNYVYDGELEITRAPLTVKIIGDSFTYGERDINVTYEITDGELFYEDDLELTYQFTDEVNGEKSGEPTAAGTYAITATAAIVGGNASVDNYDIKYVDDEPTLTISKRGIKIVLNSSAVTSFTYGTPYSGDICNAEITDAVSGEQITDEQITVAVTYAKKEESAARARMLRARTYSLREAEAFIPKDAGTYIATLDFGNCTVTDADGNPVDGGIDNYELAVDCASVEFVIAPMVLTVAVHDAEITYGEKLPTMLDYGVEELMPNGESLNLTFSFADENGNLPVHVKEGGYPVSVASATVKGGSIDNYELNYTNEQPTLTIKPRHVKLQLSNISRPYGEKVEYEEKANNFNKEASESLCDGDELTVTKVKYEGEDGTEYSAANPPENVGSYDIIFVDCTIVNADGESAKGDYEIEWTKGVLTIDSSIITVYTASATKPYDGTALSTDKYDRYEGNLGDYSLVAIKSTVREQIDVTDEEGVDNDTQFEIVDAKGNKTENLQVRYGADNKTYGKLKVTPKKAEITITDATAVYGEYPEIKHTATGLVDGEDVDFEVNYSVTPVTDDNHFILPVGNYLMNYKAGSATVVGGRGKASNYEFEFKRDAALEVTPRHIVVTTADGETEYDGSAFSKTDGYTTAWVAGGEGLLNGDVLTVDYTATITEFGTRDNDCTYTVSDNYVIDSYVHGTLSVTQRKLTAKTADVNEVYDGEAHSSGEISDVNGKLVAGHEFKVTSALVERVDVCTRVVNRLDFIIVDTNDGDKDVTENYDIIPTYGKITITKRPLEVTTGSVSGVTYDGKPHGNENYEKADGLLTDLGHELVVDGTPFTYTNATAGVSNVTEYKVYAGGEDISGNYKITHKYGKIVIGKKPVTVTLNGGVQVEYGDDSYVELLTDNAVTLVNGETVKLAITVAGGLSGKGTYTANVDWANGVVRSAEGKIITNGANNYEVTAEAVDFEVIPRRIEVTLNAGGKTQFVYGEDYETAICTVSVDRMVGSETFKAAVTYDKPNPRNVDDYTAALDLSACTVEGGDIDNYNVVLCEEVNFAITAKELTVDMDDITARYGETPAYADGEGGYKHVEGLVYGDTLKAVTPAFEKNGASVADLFAGKYDIVCDGVEVVNGTEVVTGNYTFKTGSKGTLSIVGVGLEIERKTVKKTYDGTPLVLKSDAPETEISYVINKDESLKLPADYSIVLDGTFATADGNVSSSCANTAKYKVLNADGEVAGEYEVSYKANGARLEIEPRTIKVTTATPEEHVYDGTPLTATGCTVTEGTLVRGHGIVTSNHAQLTDADSIPNTMTITVKAGAENVTANYDIIATYGTLTVKPLPVSVTIDSISKIYGENTGVDGIRQQALVGNQKLVYRLLVDGSPADKTLLNVDTYSITANEATMSVNGGNIANYEITFNTDATLTITKRHIIVKTADGEREYDGKAFSKPDGYTTEWVIGEERQGFAGLINDDVLTIDYTATLTEAGNCDNDCTYTVSDNYFIADYVNGTLTVKPRVISVTTNGINGEYRGLAYSDGGFTNDSKLLDIHNISISGDALEFLDATDDATDGVKNVFEVVITEKAGGRDVTENYDIRYTYGDVVITKRKLIVTLNDSQTSFDYGDDTFDGKFKKDVTVAEGEDNGLVGGDKLTVIALVYGTESGEAPVNAGKYTVRLDLKNSFIKYAGAGNGIGNYDIKCEQVDFEIKRNGVTFTLDNCASETYDGEEHKYAVSGCHLATELYNGESLLIVVVKYSLDPDGKSVIDGAPVNAGKYYVFIDTANTKVNGAQGVEAIETNYAVTCESVEFVIAPRKLVVTLSNDEHVYNGEAYDFASGNGFASDICEKDENKIVINVTYDEEPVDASTYTVTFDKELEFTDEVTAGNYVLDEEYSKLTCTLTIKQRKITVTVANHDVEKGSVEEYEKSDLSGGFVVGDLDKVDVDFTYTDKDGNEFSTVPNVVGTYTVSAALGGKVMNNYDFTVKDGKLIITERKVLVTPVFKGESNIYNGSAFGFEYENVHNVAGAAGEKGFLESDENVAKFVETYSYTDQNGVSHDGTPTDAGTYEIYVTLSGDGIEQYCVTYDKLTFTIAKRDLTYKVEVEGAGEYEYSNSRPAFSGRLTEYSGFINDNQLPEYTCELFSGDKPVERYNVGTYDVKIKFEGMENYRVSATTAQITITPRTIVVIPKDPYGGEEQLYVGKNLKLGALDRTVLGLGENGGLAEGDELTIESNELKPTSISGSLKITKVYVTDGKNDIPKNYNVITSYNRADKTISALNLESRHFVVNVRYQVREIEYSLDGVGTEIPYSGKTYTYNFGGIDKIIVSEAMQQVLDELGLEIRVPDSVTVPATADDYTNLISDLVYVFDGKGNRLSAVVAVCTNDGAEENVIRVVRNVVSVNLDGLTEENIESVSERTVSFENEKSACNAEVNAYLLDGEWLIGITLFNDNGVDLSANYELNENCTLDFAEVKIITLAQAAEYLRPEIKVEIEIGEEGLAGKYSYDGESRWVLAQSGNYAVTGDLQSGHTLQVLVFVENGEYVLGVSIYSVENGQRKEAGGNYRVIVKSDVAARYVTIAETSTLQRELKIDFSGAFDGDGKPKTDENGKLFGYDVKGLNETEGHEIEVTVTENEDGTYTVKVAVYQLRRQGASYKKNNMAAKYEWKTVTPADVTAEVVTGTLN